MADAVSEEIEALKKGAILDLELKISNQISRIDSMGDSMQKIENDTSKFSFEVSTLKDELRSIWSYED